jgi:sensor histidine kinase regulating citrate/malate metabolism
MAPQHEVKTSYFSEKGKFVAKIEDHNKGMNEKDIACLLKCVFDFFQTADENSDIALLSSVLVREMGRLTLETEVGEGTSLTIDIPMESKEEEKKDEE